MLGPVPWLELTRLGDNLVARTTLGRDRRLVLAGHTDTVPPNGNERARVEGDVLWGLGSADMKGGVAVLAALAATVASPAVDTTYVFYECEEIDSRFNGVERLFRERPDLLAGDAALLAEPTGASVEAGCQGTMRAEVTLVPRQVTIDGCRFREGLQVVQIAGGVAGNVVPDEATLVLNHRFAPDRTPEQAEAEVRRVVGEVDRFEVVDAAPAAAPALGHPLLHALLAATGEPPRAKLGWTDVARFAARGVPATNFGPGDPNVAHSADERVSRSDLESVYTVLRTVLEHG
jgi:succinyl-diaminopimelate desuccinylase